MENKELKDRFIDEKTGIEYIKQGDYYLPNLILSSEDTNYKIGKYGRMKLNYLKNNKKSEYTILLMDGKLNKYLHEINIACEERIRTIISQLIQQENVTEELKTTNQMEWVRCMNSVKNRAEEIILKELIYEEVLQKMENIRLYEMYFYLKDTGVINK